LGLIASVFAVVIMSQIQVVCREECPVLLHLLKQQQTSGPTCIFSLGAVKNIKN